MLRRVHAERYGFDLLSTDGAAAVATVGPVYDALRGAFRLGLLGYAPVADRDRAAARGWRDATFPIFLEPAAVDFRRGDANADGRANVADAVAVQPSGDLYAYNVIGGNCIGE